MNEEVAKRFFFASVGFAVGCVGTTVFVVKDMRKMRKDYERSVETVAKEAGERIRVVRNVFEELAQLNGTVMRSDYEAAVKEKFEFLQLLFDQPFLNLEDV